MPSSGAGVGYPRLWQACGEHNKEATVYKAGKGLVVQQVNSIVRCKLSVYLIIFQIQQIAK